MYARNVNTSRCVRSGFASTFRKTVPAASRLWPAVCGLPGDVRKRWTIRRFLWSPFLPSFPSFWIPRGRRNGSQKNEEEKKVETNAITSYCPRLRLFPFARQPRKLIIAHSSLNIVVVYLPLLLPRPVTLSCKRATARLLLNCWTKLQEVFQLIIQFIIEFEL